MAPTIFQPLWIDASGAGGILTLLVGFVCGDRVREGRCSWFFAGSVCPAIVTSRVDVFTV